MSCKSTFVARQCPKTSSGVLCYRRDKCRRVCVCFCCTILVSGWNAAARQNGAASTSTAAHQFTTSASPIHTYIHTYIHIRFDISYMYAKTAGNSGKKWHDLSTVRSVSHVPSRNAGSLQQKHRVALNMLVPS